MPAAIPFIVQAVGTYLGWQAVTVAVATFISSVAVASYQKSEARKDARNAYNASLQDRTITIRSAVSPRKLLLGTVRTSGVLTYVDSIGINHRQFDQITTIAGHKLYGIKGYFFNDGFVPIESIVDGAPTIGAYAHSAADHAHEDLTITGNTVTLQTPPRSLADIDISLVFTDTGENGQTLYTYQPVPLLSVVGNVVTLADSYSGAVAVADYAYWVGESPMRVQFADGDDNQASTGWAGKTTPYWDADHRQRGCAYVREILEWNEDVYNTGPPTTGVLGQGPYGVYDPRTGTTVSYTSNPALLAGWYMTWPRDRGGMGIPSSWINWSYVATAANICDELVTVRKLDGSGYETIKRYECHVELSTDASPADNLNIILGAMAGEKVFTNGEYRIFAGAFRPATITLTDADVVHSDAIAFTPGTSLDAPPNTMTARFVDSAKNYVETGAPAVKNDDYVAEDGAVEPLDIVLPASTDARQANYLMGIALERARPGFEATLTVNGRGANIAVGDTVQIDLQGYGAWAGKTFEVMRRGNRFNGQYPLQLREMKSNTFALDPDRFTPTTQPAKPDTGYLWNVSPVGNLAVSAGGVTRLPDGSVSTKLVVTWDTHPQEYVRQSGYIQLRYRRLDEAEWGYVSPARGDELGTSFAAVLTDTARYKIQVRAVNGVGARSEWKSYDLDVDSTALLLQWDAIEGANKPADNAGVNGPNAGIRLNRGTFTTVDWHECYIHGFDNAGNAVDEDAWITINGVKATLPKGKLASARGPEIGWIMWDTAGATFMLGDGATMQRYVFARRLNGQWQYDNDGAGWVNFTPTYTHYLIGTMASAEADDNTTPGITAATIWFAGITPEAIGQLGDQALWALVSGNGKPADNATADLVLVARGQCTTVGNRATKVGGSVAWDSDVYSRDSYTAGAFASAVPGETNTDVMFGLNSDPTTDSNYTSLDYAFYLNNGLLYAFESGVLAASFGAYATTDVLSISYDDSNVRYFKNGALLRFTAPGSGKTFFFDSSFRTPGATLANLRFGPMTSNAWSNIGGRPVMYRAIARGYADTQRPLEANLYNAETGAALGNAALSYTVDVFRRSDGVLLSETTYNVYSGGAAATMAAALNALGSDKVVVVRTYDEPQANRMSGGLDVAMYRCGASRAVFGSPQFKVRGAYVLVGIAGCGEGNGFEAYNGAVDGDTSAWCDVTFQLKSGALIVSGTSATPRTLADYSYTGDLNATADVQLVGRGVTINGNKATKSGADGWNADAYSKDSFTGGAYASASPVATNMYLLFGLNSDPTTDASYTSLDYAIECVGDGTNTLLAWESGANTNIGTFAAGDQLAVIYDGTTVRYTKNGQVLRTTIAPPNLKLFFDSSFYNSGAVLQSIRFGPMTSRNKVWRQEGDPISNAAEGDIWQVPSTGKEYKLIGGVWYATVGDASVGTPQLKPGSTTQAVTDVFDFAGAGYGQVTARSFTVTPIYDCVIEFTAKLTADNILGDSGNRVNWVVTPDGGSDFILGGSRTNNTVKQEFGAINSFAATGGVTLTFRLDVQRPFGNPAVHLYDSFMRVTQGR